LSPSSIAAAESSDRVVDCGTHRHEEEEDTTNHFEGVDHLIASGERPGGLHQDVGDLPEEDSRDRKEEEC
jgi:hypothetical protein